jgi:hypothetical protein
VELLEREIENVMMRGQTASGGQRDRLGDNIVNMTTHNRTKTAEVENAGKRRRIPKHGSMITTTKDNGFGEGVMG